MKLVVIDKNLKNIINIILNKMVLTRSGKSTLYNVFENINCGEGILIDKNTLEIKHKFKATQGVPRISSIIAIHENQIGIMSWIQDYYFVEDYYGNVFNFPPGHTHSYNKCPPVIIVKLGLNHLYLKELFTEFVSVKNHFGFGIDEYIMVNIIPNNEKQISKMIHLLESFLPIKLLNDLLKLCHNKFNIDIAKVKLFRNNIKLK